MCVTKSLCGNRKKEFFSALLSMDVNAGVLLTFLKEVRGHFFFSKYMLLILFIDFMCLKSEFFYSWTTSGGGVSEIFNIL